MRIITPQQRAMGSPPGVVKCALSRRDHLDGIRGCHRVAYFVALKTSGGTDKLEVVCAGPSVPCQDGQHLFD
jgi:hypothetical protein